MVPIADFGRVSWERISNLTAGTSPLGTWRDYL